MAHLRTRVTADPLDVGGAIAEVSSPDCGAIGIFVGTVRESPAAGGTSEPVEALEYEAHPSLATENLERIARQATEQWDLRAVVAEHRSGRCLVGDPTVVIATSAPHRADALEACRWIIDTVKQEVPIWKKELYADGSTWVGAGS